MIDAGHTSGGRISGGELITRLASALVLGPIAIGAAYVGGWPFTAMWAVAAMIVAWEWIALVGASEWRVPLALAAVTLALAAALAGGGLAVSALITVVIGMALAALAAGRQRMWVASGIGYAGLIAVAPVVLRSDPADGFLATLFLFAVVWTTDIAAFFVGRAVGGPKLAPTWSPKKTWSGAVGGTVAAIVAAMIVTVIYDRGDVVSFAVVALLLSVCAQGGDLFESALKRRFGAKNASQLIPGHGGLMDRLDGFTAAVTIAALIGLARGGIETPAAGLLHW